jgi:hypothetical protein
MCIIWVFKKISIINKIKISLLLMLIGFDVSVDGGFDGIFDGIFDGGPD